MALVETGQPAPHHYFTDPEEARAAVRAGLEFLLEVDGYTVNDVRENLVEPMLEEYDEDDEVPS